LFFGISCAFLISAAEFFIKAKDFDAFSIPKRYIKLLEADCKQKGQKWDDFEDAQTENCRINEKLGRYCYNLGIFGIFIGLISAIMPYNTAIGIIVGSSGIVLQIVQIVGARKSSNRSVRS
jgi:hypothetical protein